MCLGDDITLQPMNQCVDKCGKLKSALKSQEDLTNSKIDTSYSPLTIHLLTSTTVHFLFHPFQLVV